MLFESGATCSIAVMCNTVREVVDRLERIVEVVLVAEEALYGKNVLVLEDWMGRVLTIGLTKQFVEVDDQLVAGLAKARHDR